MLLKVTVATVLIALATGCNISSPSTAKISREKALELAQQSAMRHGYNLDKYMLSGFNEEISKEEKEWSFLYQCKPITVPGCHFLVIVDPSTGATRVIPGE